jgi:Rrf2 family transcriptional regulator, iron-sulfur cluster assembly transcription factor
MLFSRTAEYVIRAFGNLALQPPDQFIMIGQIAEEEGIPQIHVGKVLQQFVRSGLLKSKKGPTGGFALRQRASEIRLLDIVESLDGIVEYQRCAAGNLECSDDMPCPIHERWTVVRSAILDYLERNTIADLSKCGTLPCGGAGTGCVDRSRQQLPFRSCF